MVTVEGIIGDLLLQHNCVIVPAFGGFVAQRVSAQLDTKNGTMLPPRKSVLFNRQLINNDGLLIASYAQQNQVDYNEATAAVNEAISTWERDLNGGQRISIDRVGFLYIDQERNLCFEQDRFYNLLLESYGLGPIHFVSAADVEAKVAHEAIQQLVQEAMTAPVVEFQPSRIETVTQPMNDQQAPVIALAETTRKQPVRTWRYVAAAALLPIAFYSFWIPMKTDVLESGMLSVSDFNPFHRTTEGTYKPASKSYKAPVRTTAKQLEQLPEDVSVFSFAIDDDFYVPVRIADNKPEAPATTLVADNAPAVTAPVSKTGSHIIVGCFSDEANAQNLVKDLRAKGYDASVLPGKGLLRVSAGDGSRYNELNGALKAAGFSPWLLK